MDNLNGPNDNPPIDQHNEMSEEEILKRLEPKDDESPEPVPEDVGEEGGDEDVAQDADEESDDKVKDEHDEEPAKEEDWLSKKQKITVQGEELEVTAAEAFKGYMRQQDYTRKTQEAAQLTQTVAQERQFVKQEYESRINQLDGLASALYQELVGDQAELAKLVETDPHEYLRRQQQMAQKSQLLNQVQQQHQAIEALKTNEAEKQRQEYLRNSEAKLLELVPEWRDSNKRATEQREVANALINAGYSPDELSELIDHRAVIIARKAMLWDKAQEVKSKQVKPAQAQAPKPVRPGNANASPNNAPSSRVQELAKRAKRTGNVDDIAAYLAARS